MMPLIGKLTSDLLMMIGCLIGVPQNPCYSGRSEPRIIWPKARFPVSFRPPLSLQLIAELAWFSAMLMKSRITF